jgi:hypothetical protein
MLNHRKLVEDIAACCYCAPKDLPDLITHELRHMGLNTDDMKICQEEIINYMKEVLYL